MWAKRKSEIKRCGRKEGSGGEAYERKEILVKLSHGSLLAIQSGSRGKGGKRTRSMEEEE